MIIETIATKSILTRTSGFLATVSSHSLQPYGGCGLGNSLCGVGCYARHQRFRTKGRTWGEYLDVKSEAAPIYLAQFERESTWARRTHGNFGIFLSSSTEPFPPQENRFGVTAAILKAMQGAPPDRLIVQTHSPLVLNELVALRDLSHKCDLRVHMSIESDTDRLPGLPGPFASVNKRVEAIGKIREVGIFTVVTVSPLLPIRDPHAFFGHLAQVADAVVIDHFVGGDGSRNGSRTYATKLPEAMKSVAPESVSIDYRNAVARIASAYFPGKVGIGPDGFAGRFSGIESPENGQVSP
jgi:DNA repair photolyase